MKGYYVAAGLILLAVSFMIFTAGYEPKQKSFSSLCKRNLTELAAATLIYAADHDHRFPVGGWDQSLAKYVTKPAAFTCPELKESGKQHGYALNFALSGHQLLKEPASETTILYFETDALGAGVVANLEALTFARHRHFTAVVYADGHVRSLWRKPEEPKPASSAGDTADLRAPSLEPKSSEP